MRQLWEILVPVRSQSGEEYSLAHHWAWDEKVREFSGGMTVMRPVRGQFVSQSKGTVREWMIPVRVVCTEGEIRQIALLAKEHYAQESVMYFLVSGSVFFV